MNSNQTVRNRIIESATRLNRNPLAAAKRFDLAKEQARAQSAVQTGITVGEITLAAGDSHQSSFARLLVLLREGEALQPDAEAKEEFLATPQTITDKNGTPHTIASVTALRELIVSYGLEAQRLWTENSSNRASIAAATSMEELDEASAYLYE